MAQVLTSVSGLQISAASAGFAPTNSADVSAIASGYQVVSSTATQLYAGTAFLTSVNGDPISASRAGQAANASMANSAYYDGTGRLISALPDSAAVSSIASSYAESAASGKLDSTAQVVSSTAGDGTYVTSINGMGISGQGGGGAQVVTATGSASALTGVWPVTTAYLVSSINGSALLPYGYSALSGNSANWNNARTAVTANSANWNSVYNTVSSNSASWSGSTGGSVTSPSGTIVVMNGSEIEGTNSAALTASGGEGFETTLAVQNQHIGPQMQILTYGEVPGTGATLMMPLMQAAYSDIPVILSGRDDDYLYASASGNIPLGALTASIPMDGIRSEMSASSREWFDLKNAPLTAKKEGGILVTGIGELAWKSAVDNVANTVSANSASWGMGASLPITGSAGDVTATYEVEFLSFVRNDTAGEPDIRTASLGTDQLYIDYTLDGIDHTSMSLTESMLDFMDSDGDHIVDAYSIDSWNSAVNTVANNSASWGGVDSATVSAIASSYAESAASSKQDSSAMSAYVLSSDVSGVIDTVSGNSASWGQSGPVTATASAAASAYTSTSTSVSSFTGVSSLNASALLVSNILPNAQQASGNAHFHYMPSATPWGASEYTGVLSPLQYATGAALAMKQSNNYGAYYKGNEWFISDVGSNTAANGVVRAELHRTRGIHLYGSSLNSATGFHLHPSGVNGVSSIKSWELKPECVSGVGGNGTAWKYGTAENIMLTSVHDTVSANSASWTTDLTDYATTAYVDSSVSSKADSSSLSSYALSSDVSGTVDLVSTQSANWGGSALALSAGPGIYLTMVGNTLVISTAGV